MAVVAIIVTLNVDCELLRSAYDPTTYSYTVVVTSDVPNSNSRRYDYAKPNPSEPSRIAISNFSLISSSDVYSGRSN